MVNVSRKAYENYGIETMVDNVGIEEGLDHKN